MRDPVPHVFICYTGEDLSDHADVAEAVITGSMAWTVDRDHHWAPTGGPTLDECRARVGKADLVLLLLAWRYGTAAPGGDGETSYVEYELREAAEAGVEVLPFFVDPKAPWPPAFMQVLADPDAHQRLLRLKQGFHGHLCGSFATDPETLRAPLLHALLAFLDRWQERLNAARAAEAARIAEAARAADAAASAAGTAAATPRSPGGPAARTDAAALATRRTLAEQMRHLRLLGFGEQLQVRLPILDAWVPLKLRVAGGFERVEVGTYAPHKVPARGEDTTVEALFRRAQEDGRRGVALLGEPGAGKTTAARLLSFLCADATRGPGTLGLPEDLVPVFLRLRRVESAASLEQFLCAQLPQHGRTLWRRGRLLWVLDGLDEVADEARRAAVSGWIREALDARPDDWFCVTSRFAGYRGQAVLGADFLEAHVAPLDAAQQHDFVRRWYRAVEAGVGAKGVDGAAEAQRRAASLTRALDGPDFRHRRMAEIAANPLLLSVLCVTHRKDAELPKRRVVVYQRATDVMLEHWPRGRELVPLDGAAARSVLAPMAWWLHEEEGRADAGEDELVNVVEPHLRDLADPSALGTDGREFLRRLRDGSGILVSPDPGRFAFLHLSFQEYLAATWAVRAGKLPELAAKLSSSWWQEVALLALGLEGADAAGFFTRVIADGALEGGGEAVGFAFSDTLTLPLAPFLAALDGPAPRVNAVLRQLRGRRDPELLLAVQALRGRADCAAVALDLLDAAGVPRARAPVRLPQVGDTTVHEKTGIVLSWVPGGSFIMGADDSADREQPPHPVTVPAFWMGQYSVTNLEWARFEGGPTPALWTDRRFSEPRQPVVGVSWIEAEAFCNWSGLQLPTEARWEHACRAGTTGPWSCPEKELDRHAWTSQNAGGRLHNVGELAPNPWGLFDVHGNVWEWCADSYAPYPGAGLRLDPLVSVGSAVRLIRGGSWYDQPGWARSAFRNWHSSRDQSRYLGFRVLLPAAGSEVGR